MRTRLQEAPPLGRDRDQSYVCNPGHWTVLSLPDCLRGGGCPGFTVEESRAQGIEEPVGKCLTSRPAVGGTRGRSRSCTDPGGSQESGGT